MRTDTPGRLRLAYLGAFGRESTAGELARASEFLAQYRRSLVDEGVPAERQEGESWAALARVVLASNEFLYVD